MHLPVLAGTHCLEPTVPPTTSKLVHDLDWDQDVIPFWTPFEYVCDRRMHFEHDFEKQNVFANCTPFNQWAVPDDWGVCIDSEYYTYNVRYTLYYSTPAVPNLWCTYHQWHAKHL